MTRYAENTSVSSDKSRAEIERTLRRYGAEGFAYAWGQTNAMIGFQMTGRQVKFTLPLPDRHSDTFCRTSRGRPRSESAAHTAYEKSVRQRWRALALVIKAKLEAVECGITEFEDEFLAHLVLPDGQTVGQFMKPQIAVAYETRAMPPLLLAMNGE